MKRMKNKKNKKEIMVQESIKRSEFLEKIKNQDLNNFENIADKEKFLDMIEENMDILKLLSAERLEKLDKYYDEVIKKNEEEIKRLESKKR